MTPEQCARWGAELVWYTVPEGHWVHQRSQHLRGRPATHLVHLSDPGHTLCGRDPEGWARPGFVEAARLDPTDSQWCRRCAASLLRRVGAAERPQIDRVG